MTRYEVVINAVWKSHLGHCGDEELYLKCSLLQDSDDKDLEQFEGLSRDK